MTVLVTGAAGFVGYHVCAALLARGETVVGVDEINAYYETGLKELGSPGSRVGPGSASPSSASPIAKRLPS
jgi:nucleoside-diphosphate-sugar epimerase